ncbi:MAG: hypothetical protein C4521_02050 [Actinobacteria bacterium]|nr:MAG: hypothetical protein C4521_02050 [Actinomycetota bacterium]
MIQRVLAVLLLAGLWLLVVGQLSVPMALLGLGLGSAMTVWLPVVRPKPLPLRELPGRLARAALYFLAVVPVELVTSNLHMARLLLRRRPELDPVIVRVEVDGGRQVAALFGHTLTLTPGTAAVDYSPGGETIYVHAIQGELAQKKLAAGWPAQQRLLKEIFS